VGRAVSIWQPADTAPTDGTIILRCSGTGDDYQVYEMAWIENVEFMWANPHYGGVAVRHTGCPDYNHLLR
jgi:hypothetical protein